MLISGEEEFPSGGDEGVGQSGILQADGTPAAVVGVNCYVHVLRLS